MLSDLPYLVTRRKKAYATFEPIHKVDETACLPHGRSVVSPSGRWARHFPPTCSYLSRSRQASSNGSSVFYFKLLHLLQLPHRCSAVRLFHRINSWVKEIYRCGWDKQIGPKFRFFSSQFYRRARCIFVFLIHGFTLKEKKCRVYLKEDAVHFFAWYKHGCKVVWPVTKRYTL